jgi:hypothetical protein
MLLRRGLDLASPSPDPSSPRPDLVVSPFLGGSRGGPALPRWGSRPPAVGPVRRLPVVMTVVGASLPVGVDDDVVRLRVARRLAPRLRPLRWPPVAAASQSVFPRANPPLFPARLSPSDGLASPSAASQPTAGRGRGRWLPDPPHGGSMPGGWSMVCVVVAGSFSSGTMLLAAFAYIVAFIAMEV